MAPSMAIGSARDKPDYHALSLGKGAGIGLTELWGRPVGDDLHGIYIRSVGANDDVDQ